MALVRIWLWRGVLGNISRSVDVDAKRVSLRNEYLGRRWTDADFASGLPGVQFRMITTIFGRLANSLAMLKFHV